MTVRTQATRAAERLAATARHLVGSSASSQNEIPVLADENGILTVVVIGAGLMGAGIAQVSAQYGYKVILVDVTDAALENGRRIIQKSVSSLLKLHPDTQPPAASVLANITFTTDTLAAAKEADLIIEAIIENLKIKQELFAKMDAVAKESCLFTSNTSSLSIADIAKKVSDARKSRFGGLHFFNPVPVMKLVEVIRIPETSEASYNALMAYCKRTEKAAVTCKDTPGFIVNRLLIPFAKEALAMLDRGDASMEDIDTAMRLGASHPIGPFRLMDFLGVDILKYITDGWRELYQEKNDELGYEIAPSTFKRSDTLDQMFKEGKLGRKAGEGFYKYK
jgi:3-hydroxyacyl-CoA dehydrogenase